MHRVLIIDDETSIRNLLRLQLQTSGLVVEEASNAAAGLSLFQSRNFHLVLLDLGLPDEDGIDVLKKMKAASEVPVIIMTVKSEDSDKVLALDSGADDYIVKPFSLEEFKARVRAALRRFPKEVELTKEVYKNGPLEINFQEHQVFVNGKEIKLTVKEFEFLKILALQTGRLVTRNQVLKSIWGENSEDKGHYLRVYVGQLRKKIPLPELIVTDPGVGYRLKDLENP